MVGTEFRMVTGGGGNFVPVVVVVVATSFQTRDWTLVVVVVMVP